MTCDGPMHVRQTELQFYQNLMRAPLASQCCGNLTSLVFDSSYVQAMLALASQLNLSHDYLDKYNPQMMDLCNLRLTMCARHWIQYSDVLHKASHVLSRQDLNDLSSYIFHVTCALNAWDAKELSNFLS